MKELYYIAIFLSMRKIKGKSEYLWREDSEGRVIYRNAYQHPETKYGWDIVDVNNSKEAMNYLSMDKHDIFDEEDKK